MKPISTDKPWFVAQTNIKCEAKATENLRQVGYEVYFPRQRIERKNKRTNVIHEVERPLLMRYVFVAVPRYDFGFVRACEGVESLLGVNGLPLRVPARDVEALWLAEIDMQFDDTRAARIHRKEEAKTRKETMQMRFAKGTTVSIEDGPFKDFMAQVERVTSQGQVNVLVGIFGRMTEATFNPDQLKVA